MRYILILHRFANIIQNTNETTESIWITLKAIKSRFINKDCPFFQQLHEMDTMKSQVNSVETDLQMQSSDVILENMTETTLNIAAKMFIYLTSCS